MKHNYFRYLKLIISFIPLLLLGSILYGIGLLYVIPFYKIVGQDGGALYSYGYNIYLIFLSISSAGIPNAISKVISEYSVLDYKEAQHRATKIAKMIVTIISIIAFAILFIFAEEIGKFIIHDLNLTCKK